MLRNIGKNPRKSKNGRLARKNNKKTSQMPIKMTEKEARVRKRPP